MINQFKVGSLFAGVGGICLGFSNAKYNNSKYSLSFANEIDKYACETYRHNFKHTLIEGDINKILHPENSDNVVYYSKLHSELLKEPIDILTGGFPCQAFSIEGKKQGFNDKRGNLFLSIIDYINQHNNKFSCKPRILFLENVKHLKYHDEGNTYTVIKRKLEECGYIIKDAILNTMLYSELPQNRERIYIIGFLNKEDADKFTMFENLDKFQKRLKMQDRDNDVIKLINYSKADDSYYYTKEKYLRFFTNDLNLEEYVTEMYQFYQIRRNSYFRKNKSNVCPTLTAAMGMGGHNVPLILTSHGIRKLTPSETFKLQGFPVGKGYNLPTMFNNKNISNTQLYKQAGNSVSVPVVSLIATELLKAIT